MRWHRTIVILALFALGATLAGANVWVAVTRSTIPLAIDGLVVGKFIRFEHKRGVDDVHFIQMSNGQTLHVDKAVFDAVAVGDTLKKDAGDKRLLVNDEGVELQPSAEASRLMATMAMVCVVFVFATISAIGSNPPSTPAHPTT